MFYIIYQTTNLINGKIYIGKHQTFNLDDNYLGSGKLLKKAISKYGVENFKREILYCFDNAEEMNAKEREIVTKEFTLLESNYNLCTGGNGGFEFINSNGLAGNRSFSNEAAKKGLEAAKAIIKQKYPQGIWKNKKHRPESKQLISKNNIGTSGLKFSEQTKLKMSLSSSGSKNSQFGTIWVTNGVKNKKLKSSDVIPPGWYKGRHY